jgi:hypothetical protein
MNGYTPQRAHLVASNAIGETQRLTSSIKAMAKIIDLVPQTDRAELILRRWGLVLSMARSCPRLFSWLFWPRCPRATTTPNADDAARPETFPQVCGPLGAPRIF